ncbi:MAG: PorT family protein [Bacteroidaceae bacterium]|nr:PorT family protein [Bacteroidaceae bacterium]
MKKGLVTAIIGILLTALPAHSQEESKLQFNGGLRVGVQANTYHNTSFNIEGYNYNNTSQNTRIGYTISSFFRLGKNRLFVQTEATLSTEKHNFSFEPEEEVPGTVLKATPRYRQTNYSLQVPLLIGYYFVDSSPYKMGVFTGPKARILFTSLGEQDFDNFEFQKAKEYLEPLTSSWVVGLEVNIANLCFDFMYEVGMNNVSEYIFIPETGTRYNFNRNINALSFSLGVIL